MKYFGTDGIRGKTDENLNVKILNKIAKAIILCLKNQKNKVLLVGNDSRQTSDYILSVLSSKLLKNGIEIHNIDICSSPCLAYLTKKYSYPLGLMISASHNPADYNGLKFFNSKGEKVNDEFEHHFELLMDKKHTLKNNNFARFKCVEEIKLDYINHLKSLIKFNIPIIVDCANGGTSEICCALFNKHEKISIKPNGTNINLNSGCTHMEMLVKQCVKKNKIGIAFDGDGDRIHIVDTDGTIITGDEILFILSNFFQSTKDVCVGTVYTNTGLELSLKKHKIKLLRSDVGDKNVYALMSTTNSNLGGEDSGHIILKHFANTGDGVLIAIVLLNILQTSKKTIKQLLSEYVKHCQVRKNIEITDTTQVAKILNNETLKKYIEEQQKEGTKIIIRPSGTEPVLRLFVEHEKLQIAKSTIEKLFNLIQTI